VNVFVEKYANALVDYLEKLNKAFDWNNANELDIVKIDKDYNDYLVLYEILYSPDLLKYVKNKKQQKAIENKLYDLFVAVDEKLDMDTIVAVDDDFLLFIWEDGLYLQYILNKKN
jgi:hypothetical protein